MVSMKSVQLLVQAFVLLIGLGVIFRADSSSTKLNIKDAQVTIGESFFDGKFPKKLLSDISLEHGDELKITYKVTADGKSFGPQQSMVMLQSQSVDIVAYFIPSAEEGSKYVVEITSTAVENQLGTLGGKFDLSIVVGDPSAAGVMWTLGELDVKHREREYGERSAPVRLPPHLQTKRTKPEIVHMHRPPHPEAPLAISALFSALSIAPLVWLLATLRSIKHDEKVALKGVGNTWTLLFHTGLAGFLLLIFLFWVKFNLLQIFLPLAGLSLFCIVTGHYALSAISASRSKPKSD